MCFPLVACDAYFFSLRGSFQHALQFSSYTRDEVFNCKEKKILQVKNYAHLTIYFSNIFLIFSCKNFIVSSLCFTSFKSTVTFFSMPLTSPYTVFLMTFDKNLLNFLAMPPKLCSRGLLFY